MHCKLSTIESRFDLLHIVLCSGHRGAYGLEETGIALHIIQVTAASQELGHLTTACISEVSSVIFTMFHKLSEFVSICLHVSKVVKVKEGSAQPISQSCHHSLQSKVNHGASEQELAWTFSQLTKSKGKSRATCMIPCADLQLWIVQRHIQRVNDTNPRQSLPDAKLYRTTLRALLITICEPHRQAGDLLVALLTTFLSLIAHARVVQ